MIKNKKRTKIRRKIKWNGIEFASIEALRGHLNLPNISRVGNCVRNKQLLLGAVPEFVRE